MYKIDCTARHEREEAKTCLPSIGGASSFLRAPPRMKMISVLSIDSLAFILSLATSEKSLGILGGWVWGGMCGGLENGRPGGWVDGLRGGEEGGEEVVFFFWGWGVGGSKAPSPPLLLSEDAPCGP